MSPPSVASAASVQSHYEASLQMMDGTCGIHYKQQQKQLHLKRFWTLESKVNNSPTKKMSKFYTFEGNDD